MYVKVLFFYVVLSFTVDSIILTIDNVEQQTTLYNILSVFTIIEYSVFTFFFFSVIINRIFRTIIGVSAIGFYLFAVLYYFTSQDESFDSLAASVESILIVSYCIFYLFDQLNKPQVIFIYQEPNFWFVVGLMVYFSGTLFLFIQANNLSRDLRANFWKINLFANITKNILFTIAFSLKKSNVNLNSFESQYQDFLENPYKT